MKKLITTSTLLISAALLSPLSHAQAMNNHHSFAPTNQQKSMQQYMHMQHQKMIQQKSAIQAQQVAAAKANQAASFPSPQVLKTMAPPKPMTKEMLSSRLAKQVAMLENNMAFDKKNADKYAEDFARYQKHQADTLAKIMAQADKQRQHILMRIEKQQQMILANFDKIQATQEGPATHSNMLKAPATK